MRFFLLSVLVALACAVPHHGKKSYDGYQVLTLMPINENHINVIKSLHDDIDLDFWTETDLMIPPKKMDYVMGALDMVGLPYEVKFENVQTLLDAEEANIQERSKAKPYDLYNWNEYEQIVAAVDDFVSRCPSGCSCYKDIMGSSYEGRDVPALMLSCGSGRKTVYLDSLIHCREWLAGSTVLLIADRLITGNDAEAVRMRNTYDFYIAPVINPDGYTFTWSNDRMWRKNRTPNSGTNCIGTDLNRNFDADWGYSGTSTNPCSDTYGGPSAASAPETRNVQNKLYQLGTNLHGMISYHAYARMWLHAHGATTVAGGSTCKRSDSHNAINAVALAARNAVQSAGGQSWTYGPVCSVIYPASGATVDYCHDTAGHVYAYTPELRGTDFTPPTSQISPSYLEQWAGLVAMVDAIQIPFSDKNML